MLICIGEILVDIFKEGDKETALPGGAPYNVATNALLYTKEVSFFGAVGKDNYGDMLFSHSKNYPFFYNGIKVLANRFTSKAIVTLDNGERSFRFERDGGADYALNIDDIKFSDINKGDIIHIGSLMLSHEEGREFFNKIITKIRTKEGIKISFDINYRDDIFESTEVAKNIFLSSLKQADILKFSIDELLFLSGKQTTGEALSHLLNKDQIAVITLGEKGSLFYKDGKLIHIDTLPVKPVDTTGAGDAFYSYFLASLNNNPNFINDEKEIAVILKRANVVGGIATLKKGAIGVAPKEIDIDNFLNQ